MKRSTALLAGGLLFSALIPRLSAAPVIRSLANAASNITFASPLAQGTIFVIKGTGLGPATLTIAPAAFQSTTLSGTSVAITAGSITVNALMYYTSATQVAALLPSNTPTGAATVTVTYNGETSNAAGRNIQPSNLGIFTLDSSGTGPAIVTYPDYSLASGAKAANCGAPLTACGAPNPGDTLILWATGLGPVNGDDASGAGLGQAMPNVPLTLWLGGVQAPVVYQGRSGCCIGEDQIVFTVPDNVPTSCAVPLVVQIGNLISNSTVMPVAKGSRNCTPGEPALASVNVAQLAAASSFTFGDIGLGKRPNNNARGFQDIGFFAFSKFAFPPELAPFVPVFFDEDSTPPGSCSVENSSNPESEEIAVTFTELDGGSSISVRGPNGSVNMPSGDETEISPAGTFLTPGDFTITGTGGRDVGPINATITLPRPPVLVSPASPANLTVTRSNGMTVTWQPGGSGGNVLINVESATDNTGNFSARARCRVPASAGTFTIPAYILLALPAGSFTSFDLVFGPPRVRLTATGLDFGLLHMNWAIASFGGFRMI